MDPKEGYLNHILICCCEGAAFFSLLLVLSEISNATYEEPLETLRQSFWGDDYNDTLEVKLGNMRFTKGSKISSFVTKLWQIIRKLYSLSDQGAIKCIATRYIDEEVVRISA